MKWAFIEYTKHMYWIYLLNLLNIEHVLGTELGLLQDSSEFNPCRTSESYDYTHFTEEKIKTERN